MMPAAAAWGHPVPHQLPAACHLRRRMQVATAAPGLRCGSEAAGRSGLQGTGFTLGWKLAAQRTQRCNTTPAPDTPNPPGDPPISWTTVGLLPALLPLLLDSWMAATWGIVAGEEPAAAGKA